MRFIHVYLIGHFGLIAGAVLALWRADVLVRIAPTWIVVGLMVAIAPGVVLAVLSAKPKIRNQTRVSTLLSRDEQRAGSSRPGIPESPR